jgi:hypothetical protein
MIRRTHGALLLLVCMAASCGFLQAQTNKTITIRMLDGRTGKILETSNVLIRINRQETVHADWVKQNEDGTGKLTLPPDATVLTAHATYDTTMQIYVNCDSVKDKVAAAEHWYTVSEILTSGMVAPNGCSKRTAVAKPGEFVFFVRPNNWREVMKQDYSD